MQLSCHAKTRSQQRGIPPLIQEWLQVYGAEVQTHGATKRYFDRAARKRLAAEVGHQVIDRLGPLLNTYLVETTEVVVTVGVRTKRLKRH